MRYHFKESEKVAVVLGSYIRAVISLSSSTFFFSVRYKENVLVNNDKARQQK
jgi:hypothetical protein